MNVRSTRVYVEAPLAPDTLLELPRETAQHLAKVLRARDGDALTLFDGDGNEFTGSVDSVRGSRVIAAVGAAAAVDRESPFPITLIQCIPRGDRMDFIVQKATELGVWRIVPVLSQRSVVRLNAAQAEAKVAHWRAVVVNACEQCGRNRLVHIDPPTTLTAFLGGLAPLRTPATELRLVLEPGADSGGAPANAGEAALIAIGPEGGFGGEELESFRLMGFAAVNLGPRILRTETAAIAALTWLQTRFGDMRLG